MSNFFFVKARDGNLSLGYRRDGVELHLHSTYAPAREAVQFIDSRKTDIARAEVVFVYGLGLGYHICELDKYIHASTRVYVLEMNQEIVSYTKQVFSFTQYEKAGMNFCISNDITKVKSFISTALSGVDPETVMLLIHRPSLKIIPEHCEEIKQAIEDWDIKRESFDFSSAMMREHFHININQVKEFYSLKPFQALFKDIPVAIVSAGPSLLKNIDLLPELKGKALILAVGRVAKYCLEKDFVPDAFVVTDPSPVIYRQFEGLNLTVPLFFFPTVVPSLVAEYRGPKILMLQKGFQESEKTADQYGYPLIETGGSVATTATELAIYFGGNPIIFVGQDLAYTDQKTHVDSNQYAKVDHDVEVRWVKGINGGVVPTGKNLSIFLKWIENKIAQSSGIRFINATEGGANIAGTSVKTLKDVILELQDKKLIEILLSGALSKEMWAK